MTRERKIYNSAFEIKAVELSTDNLHIDYFDDIDFTNLVETLTVFIE